MSDSMQTWRESGKHLPRFMRDFHDQKSLFRAINRATGCTRISWVEAHIYVIDYFLWFMARHGYTLQKTRADQEFLDIEATLKEHDDYERSSLREILRPVGEANDR